MSTRGSIIAAVMLVYISWRIVYHYASFGWIQGVCFGIVAVATLTCYSMFRATAASGLYDITEVGEVWNDLFFVSIATLVLATLSDWGFLLYLVVPLYGLYAMVIAPCLSWIFTPDEEQGGVEQAMGRRERRQKR